MMLLDGPIRPEHDRAEVIETQLRLGSGVRQPMFSVECNSGKVCKVVSHARNITLGGCSVIPRPVRLLRIGTVMTPMGGIALASYMKPLMSRCHPDQQREPSLKRVISWA